MSSRFLSACLCAGVLATAAVAGTPALAGSGTGAAPGGPGRVADKIVTAQSKAYGSYLVDANGRALYMFTADKRGDGKAAPTSNCYDACAQAWPPALAGSGKPEAGANLQSGLLGTLQRRDGKAQLTYGGWPLYYYVRDQGPGAVTGQDVHGFGGEWYLVGPKGSKIEKTKR